MEVATNSAAAHLGVSQRQVQRLAQSGRLVSRDIAGRTVVAGSSLAAAARSKGRGRHWDDRTVAAAANLLEHGSTELISGSQRSRLRARLRTISLSELAYQTLGGRVTLWRDTRHGPAPDDLADGLTSTGGRLDIKVVPDVSSYARRTRLLEDTEGDTLLIELDTDTPAVVVDIALYAYGDTRTSSAAAERIRARLVNGVV
jgi:hypothetical protein